MFSRSLGLLAALTLCTSTAWGQQSPRQEGDKPVTVNGKRSPGPASTSS